MQNATDFYQELERWREQSFSWELSNCCHFTIALIGAQGFAAPYEAPSVASAAEAQTWLVAQGHSSLYALLRSHLGNPVAPLRAHRGDIAYCRGAREAGTIGVFDHELAWFLGDDGLAPLPRDQVSFGFRVARLPRRG